VRNFQEHPQRAFGIYARLGPQQQFENRPFARFCWARLGHGAGSISAAIMSSAQPSGDDAMPRGSRSNALRITSTGTP
jgi:hypothetical protein